MMRTNTSKAVLYSAAAACLWAIFLWAPSCRAQQADKDPLLFAYFTGNGEDGLHLAWSNDGLQWQPLNGGRPVLSPTAGQDKLMRDPSLLRGPDGLFHMVWTVSWKERSVGLASSPDLLHWSPQQTLTLMDDSSGAQNCWAPDLFYDAEKKQYLIFWASTIPGRFPATDDQMARGGAGKNNRIYLTTSPDLKQFSPARLAYDHGFNVIDATVVYNGKEYIMFLKDETDAPRPPEKNIRIAKAGRAAGPYGPPSAPITGDYWAEGPAAIRRGGRWYVYVDRYREHRYGLVVSRDLVHWQDWSDSLHIPPGARHGSILPIPRSVLDSLLRPVYP